MGINTTANKYGGLNKDRIRDDQASPVGSPSRIIKTTANMQGMKQDRVIGDPFTQHFPKGGGITKGEGKLVATSTYGKAAKQA